MRLLLSFLSHLSCHDIKTLCAPLLNFILISLGLGLFIHEGCTLPLDLITQDVTFGLSCFEGLLDLALGIIHLAQLRLQGLNFLFHLVQSTVRVMFSVLHQVFVLLRQAD